MANDPRRSWFSTTLAESVDQLAGFAFKSELYLEGRRGVRLLRGDNIAPGRVRWEGCREYPSDLLEGLDRYQLRDADVVIAMDRPWIDAGLKVARVAEADLPAMLVQRVTRLRGRDGIDPGFIWACVRSPGFTSHLRAETTGTAVPHISGKQIGSFPMMVPSLPEQRAIASVLGALDDKAESNRRLVVAQVAARQCEFTHRYGSEGERQPLDAIASQHKTTIQPSETPSELFEQFSIPAFDAGDDPDVCLGSSMASGKTRLPSEPVVLFSKLNPTRPRVWNPVTSGAGKAVCSPEFLVLRPTGEATHAWLDACVRHDERFYGEVLAGVTGTTGSRQRVKPADVLRATVPASGERIQEWTAFAAPMIERESSLIRESRTLTAIRDGLLPKLVSGKIRVPFSDDPEEQVGAALEALSA